MGSEPDFDRFPSTGNAARMVIAEAQRLAAQQAHGKAAAADYAAGKLSRIRTGAAKREGDVGLRDSTVVVWGIGFRLMTCGRAEGPFGSAKGIFR